MTLKQKALWEAGRVGGEVAIDFHDDLSLISITCTAPDGRVWSDGSKTFHAGLTGWANSEFAWQGLLDMVTGGHIEQGPEEKT